MKTPTISLLHPTARVTPSEGFPRAWREACDLFHRRSDHPERIQYVLAVHESRWQEFKDHIWDASLGINKVEVLEDGGSMHVLIHFPGYGYAHDALKHDPRPECCFDGPAIIIVKNTGRDCVVDQINAAAAACTGRLLCGVQDDIVPPEHWDTLLVKAVALHHLPRPELINDLVMWDDVLEEYLDEELILHFSTGSPRDKELMVAAAVTRKRYERYGYALDPAFESMFADDWFTFQARQDEAKGLVKILTRLDLEFAHHRPGMGEGRPEDEVYHLQNRRAAYQKGYVTFRRKALGSKVISVLMPGETFSHRWVFAMFEVFSKLEASNFVVERYGFHSSNVYRTRLELADAVVSSGIEPDFVLMVDDDNVITPQNVSMLLADLEAHPELDIVCGWCWCDTGDYEDHAFRMSCGRQGPNLECNFFGIEDYARMVASGKLAVTSADVAPDALWSGMPVVLMRGGVLARLGWEAFLPMLGENYQRKFTSEDTTFFYRAHQAGIQSAIDLRVKVPHLKIRAIEPTILPASDREAFLKFLDAAEQKVSGMSVLESSAAD